MEGQKDMESRYINLQEKRMKLEVEMEKQEREAERQYKIQLWSILQQNYV